MVVFPRQQLDGVEYREHDEDSIFELDDEDTILPRYKPVLHLRTLSVHTVHPRASSPILLPKCFADRKSVQLNIMDNILVCLCAGNAEEPTHFSVWNWCTGEAECVSQPNLSPSLPDPNVRVHRPWNCTET